MWWCFDPDQGEIKSSDSSRSITFLPTGIHLSSEAFVPFEVGQLTGLCPDVLLEISKYLYLDEIIHAFSMGFLRVLHDGHSKVHLNDPSNRFLQIIPQHLDPRQVASLLITDDPRTPTGHLSLLRVFDRLTSLTILSERAECPRFPFSTFSPTFRLLLDNIPKDTAFSYKIRDIKSHLLRCLSNLSSLPITHLRVRCVGECNNHFWTLNHQYRIVKNITILSFVFDADFRPLYWHTHQCSIDSTEFMDSAFRYITSLVNVQQVRLIINQHLLRAILRLDPWLWSNCSLCWFTPTDSGAQGLRRLWTRSNEFGK